MGSNTRFQLPRPSELERSIFTPETRSSRLRRPTTLMFRSHTRSPLTRSSTSPTLTSLDTPTTEPMALTPVRTTETSHPTGTSDLVDTSDATPATSQTAMATELVCLPELRLMRMRLLKFVIIASSIEFDEDSNFLLANAKTV